MARAARQVPVGRRLATVDRRRLVVSVIGIGAALGLILLLEGLWTGLLRQARSAGCREGFAAAPERFLDRAPALAGASAMDTAVIRKEESP